MICSFDVEYSFLFPEMATEVWLQEERSGEGEELGQRSSVWRRSERRPVCESEGGEEGEDCQERAATSQEHWPRTQNPSSHCWSPSGRRFRQFESTGIAQGLFSSAK